MMHFKLEKSTTDIPQLCIWYRAGDKAYSYNKINSTVKVKHLRPTAKSNNVVSIAKVTNFSVLLPLSFSLKNISNLSFSIFFFSLEQLKQA